MLDIKLSIEKAKNLLIYNRDFHFGGGGNVLFPASAYPAIKQLFDAFQKSETHTVTLKQK